ncbi:MAG: FAD-binding protein [Chitinophagaceae bacterium]|nr:FAD-binding protein [Chitinophagaceae bacterium]
MIKDIQFSLPAATFHQESALRQAIATAAGLPAAAPFEYEILKKSLDARSRTIRYNLQLRIYSEGIRVQPQPVLFHKKDVRSAAEVHIIGAGPAGLFCALHCIQSGLKPIIFERGKNVRDRRRDLAKLNKEGILNEESNYCFGEGGAGTYSDGKLYTRSNKRGQVKTVLEWLHFFGADDRILYEAHPHIGTNKLPHIIEAVTACIIECGGEVHFNSKLTDILLNDNRISSVTINDALSIGIRHLVLATGHSAADIYALLHRKKIALQAKPFALGVRVEHPQAVIDEAQYHCAVRPDYLPPSSYSLVQQVSGRGVFSFCMCPGGIIAPASTEQQSLVVNGWSPSKRNNPFANSGIVVSIAENDYLSKDALSGLHYQHAVEQKAFAAGGGNFVAPAMRMTDFVNRRLSATLPDCSYLPGVKSAMLADVLPSVVYESLREAFQLFGKKMRGYYTEQALVVATESRTSSPVRIPRDAVTFEHIQIRNLYPCAEGAGYAGGIVSAAMDGMNIAQRLAMQ